MIINRAENKARVRLNELGASRVPFFFIIDYEKKMPIIIPLADIDPSQLWFNLNGVTNQPKQQLNVDIEPFIFKQDLKKSAYKAAFEQVLKEINLGNSYLLNLTFPTKIKTNLSLKAIFSQADAPFKLWMKDQLVIFSPEPFVQIKDGMIGAFPMKGTISTATPNAREILKNNPKEIGEHATIVDLIRNDLSMVATEVRVKKYRYFDKINTHEGALWQTSSEIVGKLPNDYHKYLGDLIFKLLPAGSISGAPKHKTIEIIQSVETYERGYYTGVFGVFDGTQLNSGVAIRYIEKQGDNLVFKSGGGLTCLSDMEEEYEELLNKIYLPFQNYKYA